MLPRQTAPAPAGAELRPLDGSRDHLLSVRAAAGRLALSTAGVYKLCARGELPHVRVGNAIRIAPADLAAFVAAHRGGGTP